MRHLAALLVASVALIVLATPVGAGGVVAHPGEIATGYLELTEYEVADLVDARIAAGDLDADKVYKTSTGIILFGTPVDLLIDAGVIREFYVDRFGGVRRFDDPFWGQRNGTSLTEWQAAWVWAP